MREPQGGPDQLLTDKPPPLCSMLVACEPPALLSCSSGGCHSWCLSHLPVLWAQGSGVCYASLRLNVGEEGAADLGCFPGGSWEAGHLST